jgi:hypothetical protein
MRNRALFITGVTFDVLAGVCLLGSLGTLVYDLAAPSTMAGILTASVGLPLFAGALVFGGAGIPMTVVGGPAGAGPGVATPIAQAVVPRGPRHRLGHVGLLIR